MVDVDGAPCGEDGTPRLASAEEVLAVVGNINTSAIRSDLERLRAVEDWALRHIGIDYSVGDEVVILTDLCTKPDGWWPYREALAAGQKAQVTSIGFNRFGDCWQAHIVLDDEWSIGEALRRDEPPIRYWHGPADRTPEGFRPPSPFDQENHPEGRKHTFAVAASRLAKVSHPGSQDGAR